MPISPQPALTAAELLSSVLSLRPCLAVFDADGTLWEDDAGKDFLYWEVAHNLLPKRVADWVIPRYEDYRHGKVDEVTMCGEMVTIHDGLEVAQLQRAAEEFFATEIHKRIFPEMIELVHRLGEIGCELWAVSSTNEWVIRAGVRRFGISANHVLAAAVHCPNGCATGQLIRVPTDAIKAQLIREIIGRTPDVVFGNSMHDFAMMEMAKARYAIGPNPALERAATQGGWPVFWPERLKANAART